MISIQFVGSSNGNCPFSILWYMYLFGILFLLSVIVVVLVVKKGFKKRRSNLTGAKTKQRSIKKYKIKKQMEGFVEKNRSNARAYYIRQCNRVKSKARIAYKISRKYKLASAKAYSKQFHALNPGYVIQKCKNWYNKNKNIKITKSLEYSQKMYSQNPLNKKMMSKKRYQKNPGPQKKTP